MSYKTGVFKLTVYKPFPMQQTVRIWTVDYQQIVARVWHQKDTQKSNYNVQQTSLPCGSYGSPSFITRVTITMEPWNTVRSITWLNTCSRWLGRTRDAVLSVDCPFELSNFTRLDANLSINNLQSAILTVALISSRTNNKILSRNWPERVIIHVWIS